MINILCKDVADKLKLHDLVSFQGDLKKRTASDIEELANSIKELGLVMPFAIWPSEKGNMILDGHGRLAALTSLAMSDATVLEQEFPVIYIKADNEEDARKSLLQITSSYGKITKQGAATFCSSIPEYHAPAINKFVHTKISHRKPSAKLEERPDRVLIHISVPLDKSFEVKDLLKQVPYIEVI